MTKSMTALYAFLAFVLGALVAFGAQHFLFPQKDQRDAMATVGAFQGWRLNCPPRTTKDGICVLQQALARKGSNQVVAEINVAPKDQKSLNTDMLTVVAPLGVFVIPGIKVTVGSGPDKTIAYKTCLPAGCIATTPIDAGMATALSQNTGIVVTVMTADGKSVPLNFSLQGYREAMAARAVDMAARK
ncbi:MAG TPA: invasion associated locus B family protein [Rhizomicrobium sp.]|nr:invasion associated locus B family protein [Rhizomicrobium sp.]